MGIRKLRDGLTAAIRRVRGGDTPVALHTPLPEDKLERLLGAGLVAEAQRPLDLERPTLEPAPGTKTTTETLREDRDAG